MKIEILEYTHKPLTRIGTNASYCYNTKLKELIKGVMIESYLEEGCQSIGADQIYGKSITDPCLGWEDTERLIYKIAEEC